jgi:hypothetical protein
VQKVLDKFLKVGTRIQSELTRRPEVEKMRRNSHITYGLSMGLLYTSEERDKIMGNGESGAGADALGGGGSRGLGV